jgi:hypothetical protein
MSEERMDYYYKDGENRVIEKHFVKPLMVVLRSKTSSKIKARGSMSANIHGPVMYLSESGPSRWRASEQTVLRFDLPTGPVLILT